MITKKEEVKIEPVKPADPIKKDGFTPTGGFRPQTGGSGFGGRRFRDFRRDKPKDEFEVKLLDLARISHTRAGGKKMRFRAVVVVGNKMGKVGLGLAKGQDVAFAVEKSTRLAKKNVIEVPMSGDTIPHEVSAKIGASRILLRPQSKGRGLVAGGTVRIVCTLAGIKNISSKILSRTGNKITNARATIEALRKLRVKK
jgi:small subunit ribosomal protein S5